MKDIKTIFEGIFDDNKSIENDVLSSLIEEKFIKPCFKSKVSYNYENNILYIEDTNSNHISFYINNSTNIKNILPDIKAIYFKGNLIVHANISDIDGGNLVEEMRADSITINNARSLNNIRFKNSKKSKNSFCHIKECLYMTNCGLDGFNRIVIESLSYDISVIDSFINNADNIIIKGPNIFKYDFTNLEKHIKWDDIKHPVNVKTSQEVNVKKPALFKYADLLHQQFVYDWTGSFGRWGLDIPVNVNDLGNILFDGLKLNKVNNVDIESNKAYMRCDMKTCEIYMVRSISKLKYHVQW